MDRIGELYVKAIEKHFVKRGHWVPGEEINLGDYGTLERGSFLGQKYFKKRGNIKDEFAIDFEVQEDPTSSINEFLSKGGYEIKTEVSGAVAKVGKAGAKLNFTQEGATFISARECYYDSIKSIDKVGKKILEAYNEGKGEWKKEFFFVGQIMKSNGATVIVTSGNNSSLDLEAEIEVPFTIDLINDPSIGLAVKNQSDIGLKIMAQKNIALMMDTYRVYDSWIDDPKIKHDIKSLTKPPREIKVKALLE